MRTKMLVSVGIATVLAALSAMALTHTNKDLSANSQAKQMLVPIAPVVVKLPSINRVAIKSQPGSDRQKSKSIDNYMLAKIAMAEAEGEDTEGKALVMCVVLNRVRSNKFPDNVRTVIYQKGQFSPVANGRYEKVEPNEDCWKALNMIRADGWDDSRGALYFESKSASKWHRDNLQFLFRHGSHLFYTDRGK